MKLTKTEENAKLLCGWIKNGTRKGIVIEWRNSHTWVTKHTHALDLSMRFV